MNTIIRITVCVCLLMFGGLLTGCKTSQRAITSSSLTVSALVKAYSIYVVQNEVPDAEQDAVWAAYEKYQVAEDRAVEAYTAFVVLGDKSGWEKAKEAMNQAHLALLELLPQSLQTE